MQVKNIYQGNSYFSNLELLAKSIVEGYISGLHKSPFHGFSAEFSEHKIYNNGESTKHIDWKLFAKLINSILNVFKTKQIYVVI